MVIKNTSILRSTVALDLRGAKVLLVEDFMEFRTTVKNMMNYFGVRDVDEAGNGDEAVRKMSLKQYDLVLCDYNLGQGKDGQQVLEEAKYRHYINHSTIYMMVTAENTIEMLMGALEYSPDEYLMKPFTRGTLEKKLRDLIDKKMSIRDVEAAIEGMDYEGALSICDALIEKQPPHVAYLFKTKGEILLKLGRFEEADSFYESIMTMGQLPWAMVGAGQAKYALGRYEEAKTLMTQLIVLNDKVMPAYDLLAKIMNKLDNPLEAQKILMTAIEISPKAIKRQKELGRLAYQNQDLETAEKSMKAAVKQGKYSCFKDASDYTTLARVLINKNDGGAALALLTDAGKEFPNDKGASVQIAMTEAMVYTRLNRTEDAKKATDKAISIATGRKGRITADVELDVAREMILRGDAKEGKEMICRIIQSHHEDRAILDHARQLFKDLQMEDEGEMMMNSAIDEVDMLNNDGVRLVRDGNLGKAISYFQKAAEKLPDNKIINANAAYAHLLFMQKNGKDPEHLLRTRTYLDKVRQVDGDYADLSKLQAIYKQMT